MSFQNLKSSLILFFLTFSFFTNGQVFTELPSMPERVSNNAVTEGMVNGVPHVYSFSGIDSTKIFSGIHKRAFRYNTDTQVWDQIADLPSGNGRIAAGASTVKNKIYIIGGYEVFSNGGEASFDEVHIYDPEQDIYLPNGTPIPVPIDDHVQAVYKDSLIFVVTGWSNTTNVPDVQIYDPANDNWQVGTPVPNNNDYKVFGASGAIIGDTLYYIGGARFANNFPSSSFFRKGYINPNDPTDITWSGEPLMLAAIAYRAAALTTDQGLYWVGGSEVTYNFNGIAYNGSGGVSPRDNWSHYSPFFGNLISLDNFTAPIPKIMDLRGMARLDNNHGIIAGGMLENQEVTNRVFQYNFADLTNTNTLNLPRLDIFPNPTNESFTIQKEGNFQIQIFDSLGKLVLSKNKKGMESINISTLPTGSYFLKVFENEKILGVEQLIIH